MVHILLLIQISNDPRSKMWSDFSCVSDCCKFVCQLFENGLKKENPSLATITYEIEDLYEFIDSFKDLSCLVSRHDDGVYFGCDRDWFKMKTFFVLRKEFDEAENY